MLYFKHYNFKRKNYAKFLTGQCLVNKKYGRVGDTPIIGAGEAAKIGIEYLVRKVKGLGGVIVIDKDGCYGSAFSTPTMIHGSVCDGGEIKLSFNTAIKD